MPLPPDSGPGVPNPLDRVRPGQPPVAGPVNPRTQEVGEPGALRLFTEPLVTEASWLLPLALLGIPLTLLATKWRWPLSEKRLALILWGGWLLPQVAYFSFTSGLFHAYYVIMLGPPLAALVGATAGALRQVWRKRRWLGWTGVAALASGTIAFQSISLRAYPEYVGWVLGASGAGMLLGLAVMAAPRSPRWVGRLGLSLVLVATMVAPLLWSGLTTLNTRADPWLPRSGPDTGEPVRPTTLSAQEEVVLEHLLANTEPESYLVATLTATDAAPYILATGRPVLTFGGFSGSDNVVEVDDLARMVRDGELRYVLGQGLAREKPRIAAWLEQHCEVVPIPGASEGIPEGTRGPGPGGPGERIVLYDCGRGQRLSGDG